MQLFCLHVQMAVKPERRAEFIAALRADQACTIRSRSSNSSGCRSRIVVVVLVVVVVVV